MDSLVPADSIEVNNDRAGQLGYARSHGGTVRVMDDVAERLVALRVELGLSERGFSDLAGVSSKQFANLKNRGARGASLDVVAKFAAAAKVSVDWLLSGEGPRDAERTSGESSFPALGNAVGYREAEAKAREIARLPLAIYEQFRGARGLVPPDPVTPEWIATHVMDVWRNLDMEQKAAAEDHETDRLAQLIRNRWGGKAKAKDAPAAPAKTPAKANPTKAKPANDAAAPKKPRAKK